MNENKNKNSNLYPANKIHVGLLRSAIYKSAIISLLIPVSLMSTSGLVHSAEGLCKLQPASILNDALFSSDGKTHLQADKVDVNESNISRFTGNVIIQQSAKRIETEQAEYEKKTEIVNAIGNVRLTSPGIQVKSETANFNLKTDQAILHKAEYQSLTSRNRGHASQIEIKNSDVTELSDATFTSCDPGNTDWLLSANTITLNNKTRQGSASHVVIRFKDVPFFYFPYLRFPLGEERLSGFMFPTIGVSEQHGTEIKIPYYWNIHPQVDATITPWNMTKRGLMLQSEFRYLSENNNGTIYNESLNDDKVFKDDREYWRWIHQSTPGLGWQAKSEVNYVADTSHLTDFSNDLFSTSSTYLTRTVNVAHNQQNWLLNIIAEDHQILSGSEPYKRLPQITLNSRYAVKDNVLNYSLQSEAVRFDHTNNVVIGERLHLKPSVSYPMRSAAGFLVPNLSVQHTTYKLDQTTGETSFSRTVPTFSLDSGLFFERDSQIFNSNYIQTLEPQLFYVYTPFKDQSAIPVFDTSAYAFNVNQSFTDYRFNGIDRIGDDNRLTTALATRFINQENGQEAFMARIGQIYYFTNRKVQLPAVSVDTTSRSNIIAELKTQPGNWSLSSQLEWDPKLKEKVSSSSQLGYHYSNFNLDLAHRFQRNALKTREIKMDWRINPRWQLTSSQLYDLRDEHIIENLFSLTYDSCCWALSLSGQDRFLSNTKTDRGIYLKLTLKGLGGFEVKRSYEHYE